MDEIECDVREIFRTVKKQEDRIKALAKYINEALDNEGPAIYATGLPGGVTDSEEVAPGVALHRNCNGSIVEVEITR